MQTTIVFLTSIAIILSMFAMAMFVIMGHPGLAYLCSAIALINVFTLLLRTITPTKPRRKNKP